MRLEIKMHSWTFKSKFWEMFSSIFKHLFFYNFLLNIHINAQSCSQSGALHIIMMGYCFELVELKYCPWRIFWKKSKVKWISKWIWFLREYKKKIFRLNNERHNNCRFYPNIISNNTFLPNSRKGDTIFYAQS